MLTITQLVRRSKQALALTALGASLSMSAGTVAAQELKLAMSSPPTSMDPHFYNLFSNLNVSDHIFETLVTMDPDSRLIPGLAEKWTLINNLTWEFSLRKNAKFHDGTPLTADDVVWSINRTPTIVGSPGKFDIYTKAIINMKVVDSHTIRFTTKEPYPLLLSDLTSIYIVSKAATQGSTPSGLGSDEFSSGKGMVGTGRFKFVKFLRDDRVELVRNDNYWGTKTPWEKATLRFIPNGAARLAALLSGDVQAIENVPTPDLAKVRGDANLSFFSKVSHRMIYIYLDSKRDVSPMVSDKDGKPLTKNPLKDARVRKALSIAINREAIKERVMEGLSLPSNNVMAPSMFGYNANLKVPAYDVEAAKKLLADAGYPNGFNITFATPNNRYVNDEKIAQAIAQMYARIGITAKVEGSPMASYSARGTKKEFSIGLLGWGAQTGEPSSPLRALLACEDAAKGFGGFNWSQYCNPKADELLQKGLNTVDDAARSKLLQEATALAINDGGIIPIHQQVTTWATKKGIVATPRTDERTHAFGFRMQ